MTMRMIMLPSYHKINSRFFHRISPILLIIYNNMDIILSHPFHNLFKGDLGQEETMWHVTIAKSLATLLINVSSYKGFEVSLTKEKKLAASVQQSEISIASNDSSSNPTGQHIFSLKQYAQLLALLSKQNLKVTQIWRAIMLLTWLVSPFAYSLFSQK